MRMQINKSSGEIIFESEPPPEYIPDGWIKVGVNRWVPQWPACRFRRMNIIPHKDKPTDIQPLCVKYDPTGERITHQICVDCTVYKPPQVGVKEGSVPLDEILRRTWQYGDSEKKFIHPMMGMTEEEIQKAEERAFQLEMSTLPKPKEKAIQRRWIQCKYRVAGEGDCSGCSGLKCGNPESSLYQLTVNKSNCIECDVREE